MRKLTLTEREARLAAACIAAVTEVWFSNSRDHISMLVQNRLRSVAQVEGNNYYDINPNRFELDNLCERLWEKGD